MRLVAAGVALSSCFSVSAAFAEPVPLPPPAPPPLTEQAIDAATYDEWRARLDARAAAEEEAARKAATAQPRRKARPEPPAKPRSNRDEPADPFWIRVQVLLDRAHVSPGVIDGHDGDNSRKAIRAFEELRGLKVDGDPDPEFWAALTADQGKAAKTYLITPEDVNGRYVENLPVDYAKLAKLKWLGFRDAVEMLAERFHMDEKLIREMNPTVDFKTPGQTILVTETGAGPEGKVAHILVEKTVGDLRAFDAGGKLVFVAPATVGSSDTPSPTGRMKVNGQFPNPVYIYDPKKNFQQGKNRRKLTLPGGPNGPVGSMWIDLSKPTYGIHGTPDPSKISKSDSHGCVRLTNWDAEALGRMIEPKRTTVEFK